MTKAYPAQKTGYEFYKTSIIFLSPKEVLRTNRIHDRNRISLIKNYWIRKEYCNLGCYKS